MRGWIPQPDRRALALITGASSGIGKALANALAARGYRLAVVGRRRDPLEELAEEAEHRHSVPVEVLPCDLTDAAEREALVAELGARAERIDLLLNNAGDGTSGRFTQLERGGELQQVRLLCEAAVDLCAAFVPAMVERRSGAVLIVSSAAAFQPTPNIATYSACKAFSLSFGRALHAELRSRRVAVSTLCPGPVETEFFTRHPSHPSRDLPRPLWLSADAVAATGLEGLRGNKPVVIPGAPVRALVRLGRVTPSSARDRLLERVYRDRGEPTRGTGGRWRL